MSAPLWVLGALTVLATAVFVVAYIWSERAEAEMWRKVNREDRGVDDPEPSWD